MIKTRTTTFKTTFMSTEETSGFVSVQLTTNNVKEEILTHDVYSDISTIMDALLMDVRNNLSNTNVGQMTNISVSLWKQMTGKHILPTILSGNGKESNPYRNAAMLAMWVNWFKKDMVGNTSSYRTFSDTYRYFKRLNMSDEYVRRLFNETLGEDGGRCHRHINGFDIFEDIGKEASLQDIYNAIVNGNDHFREDCCETLIGAIKRRFIK